MKKTITSIIITAGLLFSSMSYADFSINYIKSASNILDKNLASCKETHETIKSNNKTIGRVDIFKSDNLCKGKLTNGSNVIHCDIPLDMTKELHRVVKITSDKMIKVLNNESDDDTLPFFYYQNETVYDWGLWLFENNYCK